ncbi:MAG: aldehyde ferredoxin oxidoreductase family protein [Chloroflexi bacterium]|nr:aldehyde ferredoxin oxidoreductase family protein [Chloroflexota bacterium]MCL5074404.1 aldehyde ferredoxin oxidoreductase family protein [Chloroflexota bacterium]
MPRKTADVDLSRAKVSIYPSDASIWHRFIGGRGYAAKLLYDVLPPTIAPFHPDNLLIFSSGPLTGTPWPASSRYHVTTKSPLTAAYGYANSGGFFGPALRHAGYDALIIQGCAPSPLYLAVDDNKIELWPAEDLWGKTTTETEATLHQRHPGSRVVSIGPAGEHLVHFAAIINEYHRAAARCGVGAVMGSKRLKAIVVQTSQREEYPPLFRHLAKEAMRQVVDNLGSRILQQWGTASLVEPKNKRGDLPTKNRQLVQFSGVSRVDAQALATYVRGKRGCFACPIKCARLSKVAGGRFACELEGPEFETIDALGPLCFNADLEAIIYANLLCNQYGLDTISAGGVIAFAMECHEHGLLADDTLSLEWGDTNTIIGLIERIALRQGIGDLLALGVKGAAERIGRGAERYAMHVKGLELPGQDGRVGKGFGLAHVTSNRGGDHLYALPTIDQAGLLETAKRLFPAFLPEIMQTDSEKYKAHMVVYGEHYNAIADATGICKFASTRSHALYPEDVAQGLTALGFPYTTEELLKAGERIINLERLFNLREGLSSATDRLPARLLTEPAIVSDTSETRTFTIDLDQMLQEYYHLRGWSPHGLPQSIKLEELGL